jgi:16S rRNA (guanine966-N2)-methyltransferase
LRIIAGAWRGRLLAAPKGVATRPTAERTRQALFDMLAHAPWSDRPLFEDATILDAFAGTGALGLEALSRGASKATFLENERAALAALHANIAACKANAEVIVRDVLAPPSGNRCDLVFLDPPYGKDLGPRAIASLTTSGWIGPGTVIVLETAAAEKIDIQATLRAERTHGAARVTIWQMPASG